VLYLRQSKDFTGEMAAIERQRKSNSEHCARRGWVIVDEYVDNDVSASKRKPRPEFERMMQDAEFGTFDVIVSWQIDRLTRRPIEAERLIDLYERRAMLFSTTSGDLDLESEEGRLKLRLMVAIARMEVERKSNRQRAADEQRADSGALPSERSFGYVGRELHELEAPALRNAYMSLLAGESMVSIAKHLTQQGFMGRKSGRPMTNVSVRGMLLNPRNCGFRGLRGEIRGKGDWEPIVEREIWEAACVIMRSHEPGHKGIGTARRWLGSGLYRCDDCGGDMMGAGAGNAIAEPEKRRGYRCRVNHMFRSNGAAIDDYVELEVAKRLVSKELRSMLVDERSDQIIDLKAQLSALSVRQQRIEDQHADGDLTTDGFRRQKERIEQKRSELNAEMGKHVRHAVLGPVVTAANPVKHYASLPVTMRQKIVDSLAVVTLRHIRPGRARAFDGPTSVDIAWRELG
jgi:DNA invertase Pin-like site-specific DNA recombinase